MDTIDINMDAVSIISATYGNSQNNIDVSSNKFWDECYWHRP